MDIQRKTQRRKPCDCRSRDGVMQPQPRNAWTHKKMKEARGDSSLESSERIEPC
jgi:hypothetical protein